MPSRTPAPFHSTGKSGASGVSAYSLNRCRAPSMKTTAPPRFATKSLIHCNSSPLKIARGISPKMMRSKFWSSAGSFGNCPSLSPRTKPGSPTAVPAMTVLTSHCSSRSNIFRRYRVSQRGRPSSSRMRRRCVTARSRSPPTLFDSSRSPSTAETLTFKSSGTAVTATSLCLFFIRSFTCSLIGKSNATFRTLLPSVRSCCCHKTFSPSCTVTVKGSPAGMSSLSVMVPRMRSSKNTDSGPSTRITARSRGFTWLPKPTVKTGIPRPASSFATSTGDSPSLCCPSLKITTAPRSAFCSSPPLFLMPVARFVMSPSGFGSASGRLESLPVGCQIFFASAPSRSSSCTS